MPTLNTSEPVGENSLAGAKRSSTTGKFWEKGSTDKVQDKYREGGTFPTEDEVEKLGGENDDKGNQGEKNEGYNKFTDVSNSILTTTDCSGDGRRVRAMQINSSTPADAMRPTQTLNIIINSQPTSTA